MANNVRLLTSFGAAACWVSKCLIPFGFVWCFQPGHFTFFCFLSQLISPLRYIRCVSLWVGLMWIGVWSDRFLSRTFSFPHLAPPPIFFALWGNLEGAFKEQLVGFLSTNCLVLRFLSLAASWEHILWMDSGVAKVNPGSPRVSSNQVCKSLQKRLSPCGPRVVMGNLSRADWDQKKKPKMPLTEHKLGQPLPLWAATKPIGFPRVWRVMDLFCF